MGLKVVGRSEERPSPHGLWTLRRLGQSTLLAARQPYFSPRMDLFNICLELRLPSRFKTSRQIRGRTEDAHFVDELFNGSWGCIP